MNIHFDLLQSSRDLRETLARDGWQLLAEGNDELDASHPEVRDETAARNRLHHLGLLTAGSVRIEFRRKRVSPPR